MSATATRQSKATANAKARAKAKAKAAPAPAKRKKAEPTAEAAATAAAVKRSEAISAAMLELADVRTAARAKRGGVPCKHVIFADIWLPALLANKPFDIAAVSKRFPEVKESTIKAWRNGWRNGKTPSNGKGKEKAIAAAIKKGNAA